MHNRELDPVAAYDLLAPEYRRISDQRRAYLRGIEDLVLENLPQQPASLLDVGAGDGIRALRIARAAGIQQVTLLEPSKRMRVGWPSGVEIWPIRAEELQAKSGTFDVITCLWNVWGHVFPADARLEVLTQMQRLLSPSGRLFLDVSHRYNARHYGWAPTLARIVSDLLLPGDRGDVLAAWNTMSQPITTRGHVFNLTELRDLFGRAGLSIAKMQSVDYTTGLPVNSPLDGHLFFGLAPSVFHRTL